LKPSRLEALRATLTAMTNGKRGDTGNLQAETEQPQVGEAFSSPVCYADEMDERYSGYADRDELLTFLNELLEAERAGAKIAARTATETSDALLRSLMQEVQRDEAHWCAILSKWIAHLGGAASQRTGAFYEKCLAISDIPARIAFINRGQGWVVRKLREKLPRMRDDAMHCDFTAMLKGHEDNIAKADKALR